MDCDEDASKYSHKGYDGYTIHADIGEILCHARCQCF